MNEQINKTFLGYAIKGHKDVYSYWNFSAITYKNKGFKNESYNMQFLNTYENKLKNGLKEFEMLILNVVNSGIKWQSNGHLNNKNRI